MNNSNPWENQLRSWHLRRPSAKLKERLFRPASESAAPAIRLPTRAAESAIHWPGWNWLFPALACLMLTFITLERPRLPQPASRGGSNALLASFALSNQIFTAAQTSTATYDHNHWHIATLLSTKTGHSISSMGSLPGLNTNNLMFKQ